MDIDIKYYFSGDKPERKKYAVAHTAEMENKFKEEIEFVVKKTKIYGPEKPDVTTFTVTDTVIGLVAAGSVEAIFQHADGKTAVLNFASYKEPGGMFIEGSKAQEESLCAESYLYDVLKRFPKYYDWNQKCLNKALYTNRALYSPNIRFIKDGKSRLCDVITCAAPNIAPSRKYGWGITAEENTEALESRIEFVLDIAIANHVDTLILGAFGCGVFGQDATEVASLFLKHLKLRPAFSKVIFAVPASFHTENYDAFKKALHQ